MTEATGFHLWSMRGLFMGLTLFLLLAELLPLQTVPRAWAAPDLIFCFALVWSARRPDLVPIWLLALVFILADLMLFRPPGLLAALMLVACFNLQSNPARVRSSGFMTEWFRAALMIVAVAAGDRLLSALFLLPLPPLSLVTFQVIGTALFYPVAVIVSATVFGVRLSSPSDLDALGGRA